MLREVKILNLSSGEMSPIYIRIAQWLEDGILSGSFKKDERIYSQYQLADMFNINPATAAKGLNLLAEEGAVYKKRGLGMFVSPDAEMLIKEKRSGGAFQEMITDLVAEAKKIGYDEEKLIEQIRQNFDK